MTYLRATARPRMRRCSSSPPTSMSISPPRSRGCRKCCSPSRSREGPGSGPAPHFHTSHFDKSEGQPVAFAYQDRSSMTRPTSLVSLAIALLSVGACAHSGASGTGSSGMETPGTAAAGVNMSPTPPSPDPRVGLKGGLFDAGQASWNMRLLSNTPPSKDFVDKTNSDLAFDGKYVIQGSYNGFQIWDISNPTKPTLRIGYVCPASQSDVSVYKNLLFVSGEGLSGRLDCSGEGVKDTVSNARLRGLRIFDISDLDHPKNVGNVQTCRGSHTHTLLVDPHDQDNVYIYISGSSGVRSPSELAGCVKVAPSQDPNSALFRIEVIKVPLAHPEQAAIISSPRIFNALLAPPTHGAAKEDLADMEAAKAKGAYTAKAFGQE